jgi:hypothetical protein
MDIFSRSKPELISRKAMKSITKMLKNSGKIESQWSDNLGHFYVNYIRPNLFVLLVLFIVMIFLIIRYSLKQDEKEKIKKHKLKKKKHRHRSEIIDNSEILQDFQQPKVKKSLHDLNFREELISGNDENSIYQLEREYQKSLDENRGILSDQMVRDMYEEKSSKMSFDELAKIITSSD